MKKVNKTSRGLAQDLKAAKSAKTKLHQKDTQTPTNGICGSVTFDDVTKIHPALKASLGYCLFKSSALYRARLEDAIKSLDLNVHHFALLSIITNDKSTNHAFCLA